MTALRQHRLQLFVHALPVQSLYQLGHRSCEDFADAKEGGDGDGASGLHLLPVAGGEAEAQHILLRIAALLAKLTNPCSESGKELSLIRHVLRSMVVRANTPRAD